MRTIDSDKLIEAVKEAGFPNGYDVCELILMQDSVEPKRDLKFDSVKQIKVLLKRYGVNERVIRSCLETLIDEAIRQNSNLTVARFFTAFAVTLNREYGFGVERITRALKGVDELIGTVASGESNWYTLMRELQDKTGLTINVDPDWSEIDLPKDDFKEV